MAKIKRIDNVLQGAGVERDAQSAIADGLHGVSYADLVNPQPMTAAEAQNSYPTWADIVTQTYLDGHKGLLDAFCQRAAEVVGERPDCPEDGFHCNIVGERMIGNEPPLWMWKCQPGGHIVITSKDELRERFGPGCEGEFAAWRRAAFEYFTFRGHKVASIAEKE